LRACGQLFQVNLGRLGELIYIFWLISILNYKNIAVWGE
jgi:hypothetical protein